MKAIFISLLILASFCLNAAEIKVAVITSDFDQNVTNYFLELDDNKQISGMRYVTVMPNGGIFEDVSVPAEKVLTDGASVVERQNRVIVKIYVENFDLVKGGTLKLSYLYNGITGTRRIKNLTLRLEGMNYNLYDSEKLINKLHLKPNRSAVGIIGVNEIATSYINDAF